MDVLDAVLGSGSSSITDISMRCDAIWEYMLKNDIKSVVWPMSRSKNIIGDKKTGPVDQGLLKEKHENVLYEELLVAEEEVGSLLKGKKYGELLKVLVRFGKKVDIFFDEVLVMDRDEKVKNNRINLLKRVVDLYINLADFSYIVIENDMK